MFKCMKKNIKNTIKEIVNNTIREFMKNKFSISDYFDLDKIPYE